MFRRLALVAGLTTLLGCGPIAATDVIPTGDSCFQDSDCVPNGCCGKGTAVVSKARAPDCSAVTCDGSCPATGIKCGCAVPVCREAHCTTAIATTPDC